ncbi:MAG: D-2-hydroxyacid dehydrogenase [Chloroflexota bacterium]
MTHIVVTVPLKDDLMDEIKAVSKEITLEYVPLSQGRWPENLKTNAEIIYTNSDVPSLQLAPNLRWVQYHWSGIDSLKSKEIWETSTIITSASGVHTSNVAQYVFGHILSWSTKYREWARFKKGKKWPNDHLERFKITNLRNSSLGILGYGSIGREIARLADAFGMTVYATKRNVMRPEDTGFFKAGTGDPGGNIPQRIYPPQATRSMLGECDFAVVTLPLTKKTFHFLDEEIFKGMRPSAYLINISSGQVIKEEDLIKALKRGWIAGAGLDVFSEEPLPANSILWEMENVLISPHIAGLTDLYTNRVVDIFNENIRRYLAGKPLLNVVNREHEY